MVNPTTPTPTPPTQTLGFMGGEQYNVNNGVATAANTQAQTALQNLGVQQYSNYVPPQPAQYPVISADMAVKDLNSKQQNFQQIQQGMAGQQALNAQTQAAQAQQSAATAQSAAEKAKADALKSATTALTVPGKSETTLALEDVNAKAEKAYEDYKLQVDQLRNGTFPLSPSDQAQIDYVKRQFDNLKQQQLIANKNFEGLQNQLGNTSGRSRYAPEIQTQILQNTVSQGLQKIADIEAQAANTVAQLQSAFEEKNYTRINQSYKALTDYLNQKSNTINQIAQNVREEANLALSQQKFAFEKEQEEFKRQRDAVKFALDNKVEKPFYLIGNTAIDSKTGELVDLAEYQRRTGQKVGLPEDQTDFSQIQMDLETPEERAEKVRQEEFAYKKEQDAIQNRFKQQEINISAGNLAVSRARLAAETAASRALDESTGVGKAIGLALAGVRFPSVDASKEAKATMNSLLKAGEFEAAKEQLKNYIRNYGASATQQDVLDGKDNAVRALESIKTKLAEYKAKGGDTNIFTGLSEKALEKGGFTKDPALAGIANDIALAIIDYRRSVSGAAFTESEKKSYDAVYPSIGNTVPLNDAKIDSLISKFTGDSENFYRQRIGEDKYDAIFSEAKASKALDTFIKANPSMLNAVAQAEQQYPDATDEQILEIVKGVRPAPGSNSFVGPTFK